MNEMRILFLSFSLLMSGHSFVTKIYSGINTNTRLYNLKKVDDELNRLRAKTGMLLRHKQQLLKKMTGMNFHNDSDIEAHLNRTFNKPNNNDDSDDDDNSRQPLLNSPLSPASIEFNEDPNDRVSFVSFTSVAKYEIENKVHHSNDQYKPCSFFATNNTTYKNYIEKQYKTMTDHLNGNTFKRC